MKRNSLLIIASIVILFVVVSLILYTYTISTSPPKYRIKANNLPSNLDGLRTDSLNQNFNFVSSYPTSAFIGYTNSSGINTTINPNVIYLVDTSFANIDKTLYSNSNISQAFNAHLSSANKTLTTMSNENIIRINLPNNTVELYVAINNGTIYNYLFDCQSPVAVKLIICEGNQVIPPKNVYSKYASAHVIYLINQDGDNLTTVSFYIYGNYSQASSTAIAQNFLNLAIDNITITKVI